MEDRAILIARLVRGEVPAASRVELDALLHWLAGRRNEAALSIAAAFYSHGMSDGPARRLVLGYLDRVLFCHQQDPLRLFGLTPRCSKDEIRARHKQLLQTFHPDRHADHHDWFTARTEQLNEAYAYLQRHHGRSRSGPAASGAGRAKAGSRHEGPARGTRRTPAGRGAVFKLKLREQLKSYVGNPIRFERRLYIVLYSIPAVLFLVIYLSHGYLAGGARTNGDDHPGSEGGAAYRFTGGVTDPVRPRGSRKAAAKPSPEMSPDEATAPVDARSDRGLSRSRRFADAARRIQWPEAVFGRLLPEYRRW